MIFFSIFFAVCSLKIDCIAAIMKQLVWKKICTEFKCFILSFEDHHVYLLVESPGLISKMKAASQVERGQLAAAV